MVQFLSINLIFLGFLQFLLGFSKVPVFLCHPVNTLCGHNANYFYVNAGSKHVVLETIH